MTPEQRRQLTQLLENGEELSSEWARILFPPEKREYELVYHGKEREEDVVANTLAVPLQPVRTFNKNGVEWSNKLIFGDNLQAMKTLLEMKRRGELQNADGTSGIRLVYIDPPFATKRDFSGKLEERAYQDKIYGAEFVEFLRRRLIMIRELLADDGAIFIHLDQKKSHYVKVVADEVFGEHNFRNQIVWRNTNSHSKAATFGRIHQTIFYYTKSQALVFNKLRRPAFKEYIRQNFDFSADGSAVSKADLTAEGIRKGDSGKQWNGYDPSARSRHWAIPEFVYELVEDDITKFPLLAKLDYLKNAGLVYLPNKEGGQPRILKPLGDDVGNYLMDVWSYQPYTQGIYEGTNDGVDEDVTWAISKFERTSYPTQKPEGLLARIIQASSNPGDLVLDAFSGSGTTCAVAEKLHRRWIGIDCGKLAIYTIQKRLLNLKAEIGHGGPKLKAKPFTLYNAGLYDFARLKDLPWDDWRRFALTLFGCQANEQKIGGIQFDGTLKACPVQVFDYRQHGGATISEDTLVSIHDAVGSKIGTRMFIIAPSLAFDFQQDFIQIDEVRYYALRIPYSIIHELHQREFMALKQPIDELAVNDTVDAIGFDFIKTPELEYTLGCDSQKDTVKGQAFIRIENFYSAAAVQDAVQKRGNRETLSMVMLDYDYDVVTDIFEFDDVFYAGNIQLAEWELRFPFDQLGERIMVVFIDIYGNEARVVIPVSEFGAVTNKKISRTTTLAKTSKIVAKPATTTKTKTRQKTMSPKDAAIKKSRVKGKTPALSKARKEATASRIKKPL